MTQLHPELNMWVEKAFASHDINFGRVMIIRITHDDSPVIAEILNHQQLARDTLYLGIPSLINYNVVNEVWEASGCVVIAKPGTGLTNCSYFPDPRNEKELADALRPHMIETILRTVFEANDSEVSHGYFIWERPDQTRHAIRFSHGTSEERNPNRCKELGLDDSGNNGHWRCFHTMLESAKTLMEIDPTSDAFQTILNNLRYLGKIDYQPLN